MGAVCVGYCNLTISTDAQAATRRVISNDPGLGQKYALEATALRPDITIEIRWCPSHCGIEGNGKADGWARIAADEPDSHGSGTQTDADALSTKQEAETGPDPSPSKQEARPSILAAQGRPRLHWQNTSSGRQGQTQNASKIQPREHNSRTTHSWKCQ